MKLPPNAHQIFEREIFTFKQLKTQHSVEEIETIKEQYKVIWQQWKALHLAIFNELETEAFFSKPKVESWTNGWNLRNHFWAAYRSTEQPNSNACIGVLLNKKQLQVYLLFQHYRSETRVGTNDHYNQLLSSIPTWSQQVDLTDYHIWPQQEHELTDHLLLQSYLDSIDEQKKLHEQVMDTSFQLGKIIYSKDGITDEKAFILQGIRELQVLLEEAIQAKKKDI
ncbi:HI_0552 family protein [Enterococcus sp. LJL98]